MSKTATRINDLALVIVPVSADGNTFFVVERS